MSTPALSARWILALGFSIATLVQLTVFQGAFYLDSDDWFIVDMGRQVAEEPTLDHFTRFWSAEPTWRPALTARTAVEFALFGTDVGPRLMVNWALHLLCGWLTYLATMAWLGRPRCAAWTAVLYLAHPLHAEALTWFHSGFEGITVTAAVLLTLYLYAARKPLWQQLLAFQLALFTRENALCVPLLVATGAFVRAGGEQRLRSLVREVAPYAAVVAANFGLRLWLIHSAAQDPTGSFHLVESLPTALITTFAHPWLPIHPALVWRSVWWAVFACIPLALVMTQRQLDAREFRYAFVGFALASAPFIPNFYDSWRFIAALPGGHEQRWYFFHLPLAFLCAWPGYIIIRRDYRRLGWSTVGLVALFGLFLTAFGFNARWYRAQSEYALTAYHAVDHAFSNGPRAVGISVVEGLDSSEITDQLFLNVPLIWPEAVARGARSLHLRTEGDTTRLEVSTRDNRGQVQWRPAPRVPPLALWWRWDASTESLDPVAVPKSEPSIGH